MGMGLTLMADDRDLIIGELVGGFKAIKEHLGRQDAQRDSDREAAIKAREEKHAEITQKITDMEEKATRTFGLASVAYRWVDEVGKPMERRVDSIHDRLKAFEDGRKLAEAEERGAGKTWTLIGGAVVTGGGAIGGLIGYWRDIMDFFKGLGHGG